MSMKYLILGNTITLVIRQDANRPNHLLFTLTGMSPSYAPRSILVDPLYLTLGSSCGVDPNPVMNALRASVVVDRLGGLACSGRKSSWSLGKKRMKKVKVTP